MTMFDDRECSFEKRFAHDAELDFKTEARRDRIVAQWAAGLMGKSAEESEHYARDVIHSHIMHPGDSDIFIKLSSDLGARADAATIRAKMADAMEMARKQIMTEIH